MERKVTNASGAVRQGFYQRIGKRWLDLGVAAFLLVLLFPILAITALLVRMTYGPPVLFRQPRPGLHGRPFVIVKLRTMTDARDTAGRLLPDRERLTRLGRWLRASSLDELPSLVNVLRGDMSLVGPRPLLMQYLQRYTVEQMRRHDVRPGITGWAQVCGRNGLPWEQKFMLDLWYVGHVSLRTDFDVLARTIWKTARREGINQDGEATVNEFLGSPHQ